jgi:drug/metabolite transporter (DMT)-like permease
MSSTALRISDLLLLAVAVVWGTSYGVTKTAVAAYPVLGFLAIRFCLTALLLAPAWRGVGWRLALKILRAGLPLGLILLGIFIAETYGVALTTASNAAFLISTCVVMTPIVEWPVVGTRPSWRTILAALMALLGALLIATGARISFNAGDWLILLAALLRAGMVTFTKRLTRDAAISSLTLTSVQTATVGMGCLLIGVLALPGGLSPPPLTPQFWGATLYLVVFCTIFAFFAQNYAVRQTSPTRAALLMGTEPVFGALFASIWLGEGLGATAWIGGALIVAASLFGVMAPPRSAEMPVALPTAPTP